MSGAAKPQPRALPPGCGLADPQLRRALQGATSLAAAGCRTDGTVFYWNHGAELLLGHPTAEALGRNIADLIGDADGAPALSATFAANEPPPVGGICHLTHRDGRSVPVFLHHETVTTGSGLPERFVLATPLVSPVNGRPDKHLLHAQKLESLAVLAGGIAHDFNNLLLGVVGNADLVLMELPTDHAARELVEQIAQSGLRAADLCRQLLAFSGQAKILERPVDCSQLVQELAPLMHISLGGARLRLDLAPDLPTVSADATQLRQVVINLVTNATEAQVDDTDTVTIVTRTHDTRREPLLNPATGRPLPSGLYVAIEVHDEGTGMSEEQLARIFEPFFTTKFMGRGLGLAAVQGIVRAHHGTVTVRSAPGKGASFTIYLPGEGTRSAVSLPTPAAAPRKRTAPDTGRHVLVVDDEEHVRDVSSHILSTAGYTVSRAEGGFDALEILGHDPSAIDLVLLDMTMPGLDGLEVLQRIRNLRTDLPVLLSSGYSRTRVHRVIKSDPACDFIQKPYRRRELLDHAASMLERAEET